MRLRRGPLLLSAAVVIAAVAFAFALRPRPLAVQAATVRVGPLEVSAEDQAQTRARDRYVVSAPVAGRLLRVLLRDGDPVTKDEAVAALAPLPLSAREYDETTARVDAAAATERAERAQLRQLKEQLAQAYRERARLAKLAATGASSTQAFERTRTKASTLALEVAAAAHRAASAAAELRGARAALAASEDARRASPAAITIRSPASGRVLRILEPSERVIAAGTGIMTVGDLAHLEVVIEMLTSQAVNVSPGMPAWLTGWGGDRALRARVLRVEPSAFTKVSALGVEEKRTNVILDFVDPPGRLGDGYRLTARIILWHSGAVLQAPVSAIFRCASRWCVFVIAHNRARLRRVELGHRGEDAVEILSGLRAGERIIEHPPNDIVDGSRVSILQ